ncbi:MAG: hypothetical protein C5S41_02100, partial [Candidatus Methanomarinus sp.]
MNINGHFKKIKRYIIPTLFFIGSQIVFL